MSKQIHDITLVAHHRPEVLERILRVIRHRGFTVIAMKTHLENEKIWLDATVQSSRDLSLLTSQLMKLYDVIDVTSEDDEQYYPVS